MTKIGAIGAIGDFVHYASDYEYVSFDLFDTLIKRRYLTVHEVHQAAGMYAQALIGRSRERTADDMMALRYRMGDAIKGSVERDIQEPTIEMVWDRLLDHVQEVGNATEKANLVKRIVEFELAMERANLVLVDGVVDLLGKLKDSGKKLIAISDMYFSKKQMEGILTQLGILEFFDYVYVSAEENLTKQTGDLFRRVLAEVGLKPHQLLHVGDNAHSDVAMAVEVGIHCVHVEQFHLLALDRPKYGHRKRIEQEVADVVKAHLFSMLVDAQARSIDHIYFLARDGIAIRDFLKAWDSPIRDAFLPVPNHSELYLNRALTCWCEVDFTNDDWLIQAIGIAFWLKEGAATARELSALLGIDEVPAELGERKLDSATHTFVTRDAYVRAGLEQSIQDAIVDRRREVERYLVDTGLFDRKSVALVDVGYSGTVPRAMSVLMMHRAAEGRVPPPPMILHLIATYDNYVVNGRHAQPYVEFSDRTVFAVDQLPDSLKVYGWLELFFKHPTLLPFLGFIERDGKLVPDLRDGKQFSGLTPAQRVAQFAAHADADIVLLWMALTGRSDELSTPLIERFANPDEETLAQMRDEIFELDPIEGTRRSIILELPEVGPEVVAEAARKGDYWIPGSILASRIAGQQQEPIAAPTRRGWGWLSRGRKAGSGLKAWASGFDPAFYRSFYEDLGHFRTDEEAWRHYDRFGRKERRVPSLPALETQLRSEFGGWPQDFDANLYIEYNPDLAAVINTPERALDHYVRYGAREGRRYRPFVEPLAREFELLRADGRITLTGEEERHRAAGGTTLEIYLARHGIGPGPWLERIRVAEFRAMHSAWSGPVSNRSECILAMCEHGLAYMPALALHAPFDPIFYRSQFENLDGLEDAELYRHYLRLGSAKGLYPSEAAALEALWGQGEFPACLDWRKWRDRRDRPSVRPWARRMGGPADGRLAAFREFVDADDDKRAKYVAGEGAAHLLEFIAARAWHKHGRREQARKLFEAALAVGGNRGMIFHQLGDLAAQQGDPGKAIAHYRKGLAEHTPNRWSYHNAAELLLREGNYKAALAVLLQGRKVWQEMAPWRKLYVRAMHDWSQACMRRLVKLPPERQDLTEADAIVTETITRLPDPIVLQGEGNGVLVFSARPVSELRRDLQLREGVTMLDLASIDAGDYLAAILHSRSVIFHEVPFTYEVLLAIHTARRLGKPTTMWIGDLVNWQGYNLESSEWGAGGQEWSSLRADGVRESALVARNCDRLVTTLAGVVPTMQAIAPQVPLFELEPDQPACRGEHRRRAILVGPLEAIDERDVASLAKGLASVADADPTIELFVCPQLAERRELGELAGRVNVVPTGLDLPRLVHLAGLCDLVIDPLQGPQAPYLLWRDALARNVRPLVVPVRPAKKARRKRTIPEPLAITPSAWPEATPLVRGDLADAIMVALQQEPTAAPARETASGLTSKSVAARPPRQRILFVNVWAPPQNIGGATRVLRDNIDYLVENHSDEFEIAIFASDESNDNCGQFSVDNYRGVPVFRSATPNEANIYWRPVNSQAGTCFDAVLDRFRPDLVHFHCLQRLGATLPEMCQARGIPYLLSMHDGWLVSDFPFLEFEGDRIPVREDYFDQPRLPYVDAASSLLRSERLRSVLEKASRRLSVSHSFARFLADCGVKCEVVENGASRLPMVPRAHAGRSGGPVRICHVGGLEIHKGAFLVEAALRGNAFENIAFTVIDLAQEHGFRQQTRWGTTEVTRIGRLPADEVANFYAGMDVLVAPSTWEESYGLVTREALGHGLWVIAGDRGAMGEPVKHGVNGFVVSVFDATGVSEALAEIDRDPAKFKVSPPTFGPLRGADEQSRELVEIYRSFGESL